MSDYKSINRNAVDDWFREASLGPDSIAVAEDSTVEQRASFQQSLKWYELRLKESFLFFPGTFMLLHFSMGITYGLGYLGQGIPNGAGLWVIASILMCAAGLGDLRDIRAYAVPAAVSAIGILVGLVNILAAELTGDYWFALDSGWSLLFLPLALIAGLLAGQLTRAKSPEA